MNINERITPNFSALEQKQTLTPHTLTRIQPPLITDNNYLYKNAEEIPNKNSILTN